MLKRSEGGKTKTISSKTLYTHARAHTHTHKHTYIHTFTNTHTANIPCNIFSVISLFSCSSKTIYLGVGGFKLLGVPALPHKSNHPTGDLIANATTELLENWSCANSIYGMSFDTTPSNTGHLTAACIAIQRELDTPLLWLACRHHIGERILVQVWDDLEIETTKSPAVKIFVNFKNEWSKLSYGDTNDLSFPRTEKRLQQQREDIIGLLNDALNNEFTRGDYKELTELSLLYLSGKCSENYQFNQPGALHKARWMAKLIYSIKILLFSEKIRLEIGSGVIISKTQLAKLHKFVKFAVYVYVPWWLTCPVASAAPLNDLKLISNIIEYRKVNKCCADGALDAMSRHLWYLTEELVPLVLFSNQVNVSTKRGIAEKLGKQDREVS